jgi:hypothetical protein
MSRIQAGTITTPAGTTTTVSVELAGSGTVEIHNKDGSGAFGRNVLTVVLTPTLTRYSVTRTSVDFNTILAINGVGTAVTNLTIRNAQCVIGNVPGPYVPNPSPTLSASQVRREAGRGVRVFGSGTQHARNLGYTGAVAGVVGAGGAMPTENLGFTGAAGLSSEVVGVFTVSGQTVLRLRVFGTPSTTSGSLFFAPITYPNAPAGTQTTIVSGQMWLRLVAGSLASLSSISLRLDAVNSSNVRTQLGPATSLSALDSTLRRYVSQNITLGGGATTAKYNELIEFGWTNGVPVDFTIDIGASQLEESPFCSDVIPNASTTLSASAGADNLQIAASSLPSSGPIVFIADLPADVVQGTGPRPFVWGMDPILLSATEVSARASAAGTAATVTGLASGGARRIAVLYTPGAATRLSVNGSVVNVGTDVGDALPIGFPLYVGNAPALTRPLNRSLGVLAVYPGNPSDAQLQAMSAQ